MIYPGEANEELKRLRGVEKDPKHLKLKAQIARLSHSTAEDHHRFAALVAEADALRSAEADALRAAEEMEVANGGRENYIYLNWNLATASRGKSYNAM